MFQDLLIAYGGFTALNALLFLIDWVIQRQDRPRRSRRWAPAHRKGKEFPDEGDIEAAVEIVNGNHNI